MTDSLVTTGAVAVESSETVVEFIPGTDLPKRGPGRPREVKAFAYLFRPVAGSAQVVIVPYGKDGTHAEGHRLDRMVAENRDAALTLIRKHEGPGRKQSFACTMWGALYTRSDKRGRPRKDGGAEAEADAVE